MVMSISSWPTVIMRTRTRMRMSVLNYALPPPANSDDNSVFHSEDNDGVQQTNHPVTKKKKRADKWI